MDPPTAVIDAGFYKRTVVIEVEEFAVEICQIQEISDAAGRTLPNREPYIDAFRNTADPKYRLRVDLRGILPTESYISTDSRRFIYKR